MNKLSLSFKHEIPLENILYLQSDSNSTDIQGGQPINLMLVAHSSGKIQLALYEQDFIRINQGKHINVQYVKNYQEQKKSLTLSLQNRQTFTTSRLSFEAVLDTLTNTI